MAEDYDNELRGALFRNDKKGVDTRPDYTGTVTINGKEWRIAGWIRTSRSGTSYMSLKLSEKEKQETTREDIPF